jgi:hypothetical protein
MVPYKSISYLIAQTCPFSSSLFVESTSSGGIKSIVRVMKGIDLSFLEEREGSNNNLKVYRVFGS